MRRAAEPTVPEPWARSADSQPCRLSASSRTTAQRAPDQLHRGPGIGHPVTHVHDGRPLEVRRVDAGHGQPLEPAVGADEVRDEGVGRAAQQVGRGGELLDVAAVAHHRDPVADPHGLLDVVRDEDDRLAHGLLQPEELRLQPLTDDGVDGGERLVHEQHGRIGGQRAGDAGPLPLTAGQLRGIAVPVHGRVETDGVEQLVDPGPDPLLVPAEQSRHRADVRAHGLVREQPDALDDVADPAAQLVGVDAGDVLAVEQDPAGRRLDRAG